MADGLLPGGGRGPGYLGPSGDGQAIGVSTVGNTAGNTGTTQGTYVLVGSGGVSLSQITAPGALATVIIDASAESGVAISAAGGSVSAGTVVFSNSNNVSFGMGGSTVTASAGTDGVQALGVSTGGNTAGNTGTTLGTVVFAGIGGVTLSQATAAGSLATITVSVPAGASATGNLGAIAAGTQTATSGTVIFSNSNSITFGMAGSATVTASFGGPQVAVAASGGTVTSGTVVFSNSQLVFGLAGSTVTASPKRVSYMVNNGYDRGVFLGGIDLGTIYVAPLYVYAPISATRLELLLAISNSSSAAGTIDVRYNLYTLTGSTANAIVAAARTIQYNSTLGTNSSYTQISGTRYRSMAGPGELTVGQYMLAMLFNITTGLTSGTYQPFGGRDISIVANEYPNALGTSMDHWNGGFFSAGGQTGIPASFHLTDIVYTGSNDILFVPFVTLAGTF